jgi:Zn-finger nucleic acid-binding protein
MADAFTCPICGAVSHNRRDVEERYCGRCHLFVDDEMQIYDAIIAGELKPDPTHYQAGWDAHAASKEFHEGPKPHFTVAGLCWRMGWNDRALREAGKVSDG